MVEFPPQDYPFDEPGRVAHKKPKGFDALITNLILSWADLDSSLMFLMADCFEMSFRNTRVLVGNMDIKGRLGKLKSLGVVMGYDDFAAVMARLERDYSYVSVPRNTVCHQGFMGTIADDPDLFIFGPSRAERGPADEAKITVLHRKYFVDSREWAEASYKLISELGQVLKSTPLSELERDYLPTLQSTPRKKQSKQPPSSEG